MNKNKSTLTVVVVSGTEVEVEYNANAPLRTVVNHALSQTGNSGQPASDKGMDRPISSLTDEGRKRYRRDISHVIKRPLASLHIRSPAGYALRPTVDVKRPRYPGALVFLSGWLKFIGRARDEG